MKWNLCRVKSHAHKVICRIKGGLGNQLFCYAAARRFALVNGADLVIDHISGFEYDDQYQRKYALDQFSIQTPFASASERMEPFQRIRRKIARYTARYKPFEKRLYIEQANFDFEPRLLSYKINHTLILDGLWQSEDYFKDIETVVRNDLRIKVPQDNENQKIYRLITESNHAVAIHVRWFHSPQEKKSLLNLPITYYQKAIAIAEQHDLKPHYFVFSDNPLASQSILELPANRVTFVAHNNNDEKMAFADLWLMQHCRSFILSNSTLIWWGAWLNPMRDFVVFPGKDTFTIEAGQHNCLYSAFRSAGHEIHLSNT